MRSRLTPPRVVKCPPPSPRLLNVCGVEESDFRDSSTLCLWSFDPRWSEAEEEGEISVKVNLETLEMFGNKKQMTMLIHISQVNMESDQTSSAPSEADTSEEVFLTGASRLPASTTAIHNANCDDLEVARRISFTSAASPVCRLQFFQPADKEKEQMNGSEDSRGGSPTCEGVFIYDDLERKARFVRRIHQV